MNEPTAFRFKHVVSLSIGTVFFFLLSFEGIVEKVLSWLRLSLDVRFWSMGIGAAGLFLTACTLSALVISTGALKKSAYGPYLFTTGILILAYFIQAHRRTYYAPFWDDLSAVFEWLPGYIRAGSTREKFDLLFSPYWECKTPVSRMVSVLLMQAAGPWFLVVQKYFNGVLLVFLSWLLSLQVSSRENRLIAYLFSLLLFLNFQHFHTALCAFSGTTYYLCLIFGILAFHYSGSSMAFALFFGSLSALTFGNGWLVLPMLTVIYLLQGKLKNSGIVALFTAALATWYFNGYHPQRLSDISQFSWTSCFGYFILFTGNHGQFLYSKAVTAFFGVFTLSAAIYFTAINRPHRSALKLLYILLFMIGTAAMASGFRHQLGTAQALSVRYGFYSLAAFICSLFLLADKIPPSRFNRLKKPIIYGAVVFTAMKLFFFYPEMAIGQEETRELLNDWKVRGRTVPEHTPFYIKGATALLDSAENYKLWKLVPADTAVANNHLFTIQYISEKNRWRRL